MIVTVRELQHNLKGVLRRAERGERVEITRRGRRIAELGPLTPPAKPEPWPDIMASLRETFGNRMVEPPPSRTLLDDRDR